MNGGMPNIDQGGQAIAGRLNGGVPNMDKAVKPCRAEWQEWVEPLRVVHAAPMLEEGRVRLVHSDGTMHVPVDWKLLSMVDGPRCAMISGIVSMRMLPAVNWAIRALKQPLSESGGAKSRSLSITYSAWG